MSLPFKQIMNALTALNATSDVLNPADVGNCKEVTFYLVFSAGAAAGAVQIEESAIEGYAGTWAPIGSAVTFGNDVQKTVKASGVNMFVRARISSAITGGTVTIYTVGKN